MSRYKYDKIIQEEKYPENIFISQPIGNLTDDEIFETRKRAIDNLTKLYPYSNFIDSYIIEDAPKEYEDPGRFYILKSLEMLSKADLVYFCDKWWLARGCRLEYYFALEYGINIISEEEVAKESRNAK